MKKIISGLISIALVVTNVITSISSASFNPNKDPNGDGVLNLADYVYVKQCLAGKYKPSNLSALDVDDNNVVSDVDAKYIMMYDAGVVSMSMPMPDGTNSMLSPTYSTRTYKVYNATTGSYKRTYTLSTEEDYNGASPNVVVGTEDRVIDWTKSGVVKIINSAGVWGTGFVVGDHTIATAAHCLVDYSNLTKRTITNIKFFDSNGNVINLNVTPVEYHIPNIFLTYNGNGADLYCEYGDYALITIAEDIGDYNIFNLGMTTDTFSTQQPITITGFPKLYQNQIVNNTTNKNNMYTGNGHFISWGNYNNDYSTDVFKHNVDATPGNSGSPIYITESVNNQVYFTVIGINVSESNSQNANFGTRFNPEILKFYNGNINLIY